MKHKTPRPFHEKLSWLLADYAQSPQQIQRHSLLENVAFVPGLLLVLAFAVMLISWLLDLIWPQVSGA